MKRSLVWNADRKVYELSFSGRISDIASRKLEHPDPFCSICSAILSKSVFALGSYFHPFTRIITPLCTRVPVSPLSSPDNGIVDSFRDKSANWHNQKIRRMMKNTVASTPEELAQKYRLYSKTYDFSVGDLVQWKPGLKCRKRPAIDELGVVTAILDAPVFATDKREMDAGCAMFREPLNLCVGVIDDDGEFMVFFYDRQRFMPAYNCAFETQIGQRLRQLCFDLVTPPPPDEQLKPGHLVKWKPTLKNKKKPEQDELAIVVSVLDTPVYDNATGSGSPYFMEPLDLRVAMLDNDGDWMIFHFDKRRFEKMVIPPTPTQQQQQQQLLLLATNSLTAATPESTATTSSTSATNPTSTSTPTATATATATANSTNTLSYSQASTADNNTPSSSSSSEQQQQQKDQDEPSHNQPQGTNTLPSNTNPVGSDPNGPHPDSHHHPPSPSLPSSNES
ncbi:hypothetical protein Pelo_15464 [Pelomyxa schiedti]|nr:hypothetical protein Pelo_15464 [Pelomyxa schiedti]